jgi:serine/threonine protein kinase
MVPLQPDESDISTQFQCGWRVSEFAGCGGCVGQFQLVRLLGRGGMGEVFEAIDLKLDRVVAVKLLQPGADTSENRRRFRREAVSAARAAHENVLPILHYGEDNGTQYLVTPLLPGESLRARLGRARPVTWAEVIWVARGVARALIATHQAGLVHRDIKPGNIFVDVESGRVVLIDYGLARRADDRDLVTACGTLVGTPAYMAPESVAGVAGDPRSDLYQLGAVLFEMITGTPPVATDQAPAARDTCREPTPPPGPPV